MPSFRGHQPAAAVSVVVSAGQAFDDFPRDFAECEDFAALGFGVGVGGFAGGEGGEVGFVHGAAGLGAEDEESIFWRRSSPRSG